MLTIKEIARALGLDHSSVSRILNGRSETHKYNPETVERVKAYARERGFRKNSLAAGLKSGRAGLIGATFPDIGNPFFGKLAALIDKELEKHGFRMILANSGSSPEKEAENIESFISHRVDGVIYSPSSPGRFTPPDEITVPIVTVDCPLDAGLSHAGMDNQATFGELARRIREKGYKKTGILCYKNGVARRDAFLSFDSSEARIIAPPARLQRDGEYGAQIEWLLARGCDVLAGTSENSTLCLLEYIAGRRTPLPARIGVTGFRDSCLMEHAGAQISGVRQPVEKYAAAAVETLTREINEPGSAPVKILFPGEFIERSSL